jgi:hypothetical protein
MVCIPMISAIYHDTMVSIAPYYLVCCFIGPVGSVHHGFIGHQSDERERVIYMPPHLVQTPVLILTSSKHRPVTS